MPKVIDNNFSAIAGKKLMKISQISEKTGISRTTLTNLYYRRSTKISFDVLDKLCKCLDCNVSDLFEYKANHTS